MSHSGGLKVKHPYGKLIHIDLISIVSVILIGIFAFIQGYILIIFLCFYLLTLSLFCDALIKWYTNQKNSALLQFLRATMLFLLSTYLVFSSFCYKVNRLRHNLKWGVLATKKHYAFRWLLLSLLVITQCWVTYRSQLPQQSPCFFFAGIAYTTYTTISYSSTSIKNIQPLHSLGEWRVVTPRKYKPIFFVRCKSCRSIPGPAGIARVRRPHRTILRKVD